MSEPRAASSMATPPAHEVVRASAGTGKTFLLSSRYLTLLRRGVEPETILATTFTRKAAAEILGRVLLRLADAAANPPPDADLARPPGLEGLGRDEARRVLRRLLGSMHRVSICTIDSFFSRVVQCFRLELEAPAAAAVIGDDDPIAVSLRRRAIDAMLREGEPDLLVQMLGRLHHDSAQRRVTDALNTLFVQLHEIHGQAGAAAWAALDAPPALAAHEWIEAQARLAHAEETLPDGGRLRNACAQNRELAAAGDWVAFLTKGPAAAIAKGQSTYSRSTIDPDLVDALRPLIAHARAELQGRFARRIQAMRELLDRFEHHYRRFRRQEQVLLFSDLTAKLARDLPALGPEACLDVYYRLDAAIGHLMLDEFQDTSVAQWQVLRPIAHEIWSHGPDPASGRTFFCVGDTKQAIYGWRGGCAAILAEVEADLARRCGPQAPRTLSRSFRSSPIVLEAVNQVFSALPACPALADQGDAVEAWLDGFERHTAEHAGRPGYVELLTTKAAASEAEPADLEEDPDAAEPAAPAHMAWVARKVAALAGQMPGHTIGVLVRTNQAVKVLIDLLHAEGVAASGEGGSPINDDPAVNVILSALTMADHPGHSAAAFHVAHSPLGPLLGLDPARPGSASAAARSIRQRLATDGFASTIGAWARELAPAADRRGSVRLMQLVELADRHESRPQAARLRSAQLVRFVEAQPVDEPAAAPVRVMTIHKSKGLEFDIVVLPELDRRLGRVNGAVWTLRDRPAGEPVAIFPAVAAKLLEVVAADLPRWAQAHRQERSRRLHDDLSALYVAMTRARHALHLLVSPLRARKDGSPGKRGLSSLSEAAILRHALRQVEEGYAGDECLYRHGDPGWARAGGLVPAGAVPAPGPAGAMASLRLRHSDAPARRSWPRHRPSAVELAGAVDPRHLLRLDPPIGRLRGALVHAWLQHIEWLDGREDLPDDGRLLAIAAEKAAGQSDRWVRDQIHWFRRALAAPAVHAALARPAGEVELWRERPFAVRLEATLVQGVFDRVVVRRDREGGLTADLLDFKTDPADAGASTGHAEQYRPQLEAYRSALARMLRIGTDRICASLVLLGAGQVVRLA